MTGYDDAAKAISFQISHTGAYTIVGKEDAVSLAQAADTEHSRSPILLFIPACLLLLSAGECFPKEGGENKMVSSAVKNMLPYVWSACAHPCFSWPVSVQ